MNAGVEWENEQREQARRDSPGSATAAQKQQLVQENEARADRREARDGSAPSIADQQNMARQ